MPQKAQHITDLDALFETKQVKVGGKVYTLPADIPITLMLKFDYFAEQGEDLDEWAATKELYEEVLDLFRVHQPDLKSLPIGVGALVSAVPRIYGDLDDDAEEQDEGGARPSRAGTKSTSPKKRTRSRSTT